MNKYKHTWEEIKEARFRSSSLIGDYIYDNDEEIIGRQLDSDKFSLLIKVGDNVEQHILSKTEFINKIKINDYLE